ncbi:MAG: thiamine diphosphokinase [Aristaeellaceae bacterium]
MGKCIILAPLYRGEEQAWLRREEGDLLLCADGGYDAAMAFGMRPDLVVGDFDSMPAEHVRGEDAVLRLPVHKDDTDMVVCLQEGRKRGYRTFRIGGGLGGRIDHTLANLQCLCDCALRGEEAWLCDAHNRVTILPPGEHLLHRMPGRRLSLLAFTPQVTGVTLRGTVWELTEASLSSRYPLGVSNEFVQDTASLRFTDGLLLVVHAEDAPFVRL